MTEVEKLKAENRRLSKALEKAMDREEKIARELGDMTVERDTALRKVRELTLENRKEES